MTWLNGVLLPADQATVPVGDHGLTTGDGVFEAIRVVDGVPFAFTRHLDRLAASARVLELAAPPPTALRAAVAELLEANAEFLAERSGAGRLRLTVTGGSAPPGAQRGDGPVTVIITLAALPAWPTTTDVVLSPWPRNERSAIAGAKTTSYAEGVRILADAARRGASEALLANTRGELCEGTTSNVFVGLRGRLYTPPLSSGCLAGVTRSLLLEWTDASERVITMDELAQADEVFITATTRSVHPVRSLDGRVLPAPGPLTSAAAKVFRERSAGDLDP